MLTLRSPAFHIGPRGVLKFVEEIWLFDLSILDPRKRPPMWWESFMLIESAQMSHSLTWYDSLLEVGEVSPSPHHPPKSVLDAPWGAKIKVGEVKAFQKRTLVVSVDCQLDEI